MDGKKSISHDFVLKTRKISSGSHANRAISLFVSFG
jgi:hypothetical protein